MKAPKEASQLRRRIPVAAVAVEAHIRAEVEVEVEIETAAVVAAGVVAVEGSN